MKKVLALGVCLISCLIGCSKGGEFDKSGCIMTSTVSYDDNTWEVYRGLEDSTVYLVKNGVLDSTDTLELEQLKPIISIPSVDTEKDLDTSSEIGYCTYISPIKSSISYVNYLKSRGYKVVLEAKTPDFYEVVLKSSADATGKLKRLIISNDIIVVYSTSSIEFNIKDYII